MPSGAHVFALGGFGAAVDGGVQDSEATVTRQFIETYRNQRAVTAVTAALAPQTGINHILTGLPAGGAVATVTGLLAAVEAAVEFVAADHEALVF